MAVRDVVQAAAGVGGGDNLYVEDVFSTYLYTGNGSTQTITNGIDLAGEGGLVWTKNRDSGYNHFLYDTERGVNKYLISESNIDQQTVANSLTAFNSDGFTLGSNDYGNITSGAKAVSWTFRKAPKFFDVVTWTGNGVAGRTVAHNLGSVPGMIIVKRTDSAGNWAVYHRSLTSANHSLLLNLTGAQDETGYFANTNPTDTEFSVGVSVVNNTGGTYVAYLFAHDAGGFGDDGEQNVISCGSFTNGGSTVDINLGYEPQFVLMKKSSGTGNWFLFDTMRGLAQTSFEFLYPNLSGAAESKAYQGPYATATGFSLNPVNNGQFASGAYIYIAIRRPMKTPESGTEVFKPLGNAPASTTSGVGFPADMSLAKAFAVSQDWLTSSRLTNTVLYTNSTAAEGGLFGTAGPQPFDTQDGFKLTSIGTSSYAFWAFKRAPGFMDVVAYTGAGALQAKTHNLGVVPELIIVKCRSNSFPWFVYSAPTGNASYLTLESINGAGTGALWQNTTPTNTQFFLSGASGVGGAFDYVAYLFASLPGVSKVGSYVGNGTTQTIDCGFSNGARFVLIKKTSAVGYWTVFDTARGIVAGNDKLLRLNTTDAELTAWDSIDPHNSGFTVQTSSADLNDNGVSYIFLAIA